MAASTSSGKLSESAIQRQHDQLRSLLEAIAHRFEHDRNPTRNLVSLLNSLAGHLQMHFELEESDGYFSQLSSKRPDLSATVEKILREHVEMLKAVDYLVVTARENLARGHDTTELAESFDCFREQFNRHEHEENKLIQEIYNVDIGTKD